MSFNINEADERIHINMHVKQKSKRETIQAVIFLIALQFSLTTFFLFSLSLNRIFLNNFNCEYIYETICKNYVNLLSSPTEKQYLGFCIFFWKPPAFPCLQLPNIDAT